MTVTDTGVGVPEGDVDTLFEAFTQADASTTPTGTAAPASGWRSRGRSSSRPGRRDRPGRRTPGAAASSGSPPSSRRASGTTARPRRRGRPALAGRPPGAGRRRQRPQPADPRGAARPVADPRGERRRRRRGLSRRSPRPRAAGEPFDASCSTCDARTATAWTWPSTCAPDPAYDDAVLLCSPRGPPPDADRARGGRDRRVPHQAGAAGGAPRAALLRHARRRSARGAPAVRRPAPGIDGRPPGARRRGQPDQPAGGGRACSSRWATPPRPPTTALAAAGGAGRERARGFDAC